MNDALQDLGILAYCQLQRELGVNGGSVINFAKDMINRTALARDQGITTTAANDGEIPGLIVMNTGQLLYSHKYNQTMTTRSWYALPRKSIAHDHVRIHDQENYVEGHRTSTEHIRSVFDQLLCDPDRVAADAEVYIVAIEGGADKVLDVFKENCKFTLCERAPRVMLTCLVDKYGSRVTSMAIIHSLVDNSEITYKSLKAFLHQRTRQWKYTDLNCAPTQCVELPADYSSKKASHVVARDTKVISWSEELPRATCLQKRPHCLVMNEPVANSGEATAYDSQIDTTSVWKRSSVLCPTFAGGRESSGECVFTNPIVQHAILSFFEEVAQDPEHYQNPAFTTFADIPHPSAGSPFALSAGLDVSEDSDTEPKSALRTPEQVELEKAREKLADMRIALDACPESVGQFAEGRAKLAQRIANQEAEVEKLQAKALSWGTLGAGETKDLRENYRPEIEGRQVSFAGAMVDSELLKAAGLWEAASEEHEDLHDEDEKAFL